MRLRFDHGTPAPLRKALIAHSVATAHEMGWDQLDNGSLLTAAEAHFDAVVTTDKNLRHQQNLSGRRLAVVILPTTAWPVIRVHQAEVLEALETLQPGACVEVTFRQLNSADS